MGLLDKAKAAAEQAAAKAKETTQDLQAKKELFQAYNDLGKTAFELADRGELSHPRLTEHVERIRALKAEAENTETETATVSSAGGDQPPAMPT
jgi:cob(I)alamin adenosyltransferase